MNVIDYITITCNLRNVRLQITFDYMKNVIIKTITATKNIKYKLRLQRLDFQTNNISISISFGFQKFSENSLSACVKHNKL
jgi:hypothetical protein